MGTGRALRVKFAASTKRHCPRGWAQEHIVNAGQSPTFVTFDSNSLLKVLTQLNDHLHMKGVPVF